MINLNTEFSDPEVFFFLQRSFKKLHPTHLLEGKNLPSGLMREEIVQIETLIGAPFRYAKRVIEITELSSLKTGEPLTYFHLLGFCRTPEAPMERVSEISVHCGTFRNAPPGRFSGPVLIQATDKNPEQHPDNVAMVLTSVLRNLSRVLHCDHPKIHPDSIKRFAFSVNGSE